MNGWGKSITTCRAIITFVDSVLPGYFFLLLLLLSIFGFVGRVLFIRYRATRQGLPPPSWRSYFWFVPTQNTNYPAARASNPLDWIKDQFAKLRSGRTARGAYEEAGDTAYPGPSSGARRGRGLEDDAWDTRVGNDDPYEAGPGGYYEEQELGIAPTPGLRNEPYAGASQDYMNASRSEYDPDHRGRSKSREPPTATGNSGHLDPNPFGDQHESSSLRSVSPRPEVDTQGHKQQQASLDSDNVLNTSPVNRKSMFREGL